MKREWKPGDVAMVSGKDGGEKRALWQGNQWATEHARYYNVWQVNARPLVVIDPEDREQVEEFTHLFLSHYWSDSDAQTHTDAGQVALREFANPTPPKPDEPTGLGAVVVDADGCWWTRFSSRTGYWWRNHMGRNVRWADLDVVAVLSDGVVEP